MTTSHPGAGDPGVGDDAWVTPVLQGEHVLLRPYRDSDADALWEMVQDEEGANLTATTATFTRDQTDAWVGTIAAAQDRLDWVIEERDAGVYAGEVVLNERNLDEGTANFRIALRGPGWYGRGLGSEATMLVCRYAFETLGLRRLTLGVLARNPRAQRVYEKAGFLVSGTEHEDGEDWIDMELTAHRWRDVAEGIGGEVDRD